MIVDYSKRKLNFKNIYYELVIIVYKNFIKYSNNGTMTRLRGEFLLKVTPSLKGINLKNSFEKTLKS